MKKFSFILAILIVSIHMMAQKNEILPVTFFKGIQVTGITISDNGRMFVNFPRWRKGVPYSVLEIKKDGSQKPYPDWTANSWEIGQSISSDKFVCVQSVVADGNKLYVLDTKSPLMKETIATPTVYVYDLNTDKLVRSYTLAESTKPESYVNDLRIDNKKGKIYFTDSGRGGIIVLDIRSGKNYRLLDNHPFTTAEVDHLMVGDTKYTGVVQSDGIALDRKNDILYFHSLSGHTLYGVPTSQLINRNIDEKNIFKMKTPAPDGMIMDDAGNLYMGDLEKNAIVYLTPSRKEIRILADKGDISWPDTFTIHDGYLYYTNSRIHEANGDISKMVFTVDRIKLPNR